MTRSGVKSLMQWVVPMLVIIIVTFIGVRALRSSHASGFPPGSPSYRILKIFTSANESSTPSAAQIQTQADHFSLIVQHPGGGYNTAQVHSMATSDAASTNGGNIGVIQYINASHIAGCSAAVAAYGGTVVAHNSAGGVMAHGNNFVIDIGKSVWQNDRAQAAKTADSTQDGTWFDVLGPEVISAGYNTVYSANCSAGGPGTGVPVDGSGHDYTPTSWAAVGGQLLSTVKAANPGKLLGFNGSRSGTEPLWASADYGMHENWLGIKDPNVLVSSKWKTDLDELVTVANSGKVLQAYVKPCYGNYTTACTGTVDATGHGTVMNNAHKFALGTFLLGTNGNQMFSFRYDGNPDGWDPYWSRLLIGTALGSYQTVGSVYYRAFSQGFSIVNTGGAQTVTVPGLQGNFTDIDGVAHAYAGSVAVPATSALILIGGSGGGGGGGGTPPSVNITAPTNGATVSGANVNLAATATGSSITNVQLKVDGNTVATCTAASCSGTWNSTTVTNGTHSISATATNSVGTGSASISVKVSNTITGNCTGNPTVPVLGTKPTVTNTTVSLSWQASTAATGCTLQGYQVYRAGTPVGQTTGTTFTDTNLTANTTYSYTVSALDTNGHTSAQSAAVSATTGTTTPPPPPGTVTATITSPKNNSVIWGNVKITAKITGLSPGHVAFLIDNHIITYTPAGSATIHWQTNKFNNGKHTISVNAYNSSNQLQASAAINVKVDNLYCLPKLVALGQNVCF